MERLMFEEQTTPNESLDLERCAVAGGIPVGVVGLGRCEAMVMVDCSRFCFVVD